MPDHSFTEALARGGLVLDGAMGTALYERGVLYTACFEQLCVTQPDLVRQVHRCHLEAGARVLGTNTFGANRYRLERHGLSENVEAFNRAAVTIARAEADGRAFVAGAVGPTGLLIRATEQAELSGMRAAFEEQIGVLAEASVDALVLETFRQPREIELALAAARTAAPSVPTIACVSFDPLGTTADGSGPEEVAQLLADWGATAIGVNCADGPAGVYEMVTRMAGPGLPLVAQPNAGLPQRIEGRFAYMATPEYFQLYARRLFKAGVKAVGGCCGTNAEHVRKVAAAARMLGSGGTEDPGGGMRDDEASEPVAPPGVTVVETADKGTVGARLGREFVVSVEINPPPGLSLAKALAGAQLLKDAGIDMVNVTDGARAAARMGNLALCHRIQEEVGIPAMMHVTTRDRNLLGLLAHVLAAHELGVHNLVVITGDPPKMGDLPDATPVYDLDSIGLLRLLRGLNHGLDPGGKSLGGATRFLCATGAEPAASDYERELSRLRKKADAGAEFVMTQPVYDSAVLDRFLRDVEPLGLPVLVGLLPLANHRNAEFLHNEVPGMRVPDSIRARMRKAQGPAQARAEGVAIAREMLTEVKARVQGAYIMPPFGRYQLAVDVVKGIVR
ncbi:MAG: bifunctional homocysteine S-methyltransferase/methylenetetrahydrofolate reductase [Myxococcales bacterium]|nr:bifunctional homocysteine S-methyltransferase/methylenetetrahydrofolate reductase [Myxococcales bacterium]